MYLIEAVLMVAVVASITHVVFVFIVFIGQVPAGPGLKPDMSVREAAI